MTEREITVDCAPQGRHSHHYNRRAERDWGQPPISFSRQPGPYFSSAAFRLAMGEVAGRRCVQVYLSIDRWPTGGRCDSHAANAIDLRVGDPATALVPNRGRTSGSSSAPRRGGPFHPFGRSGRRRWTRDIWPRGGRWRRGWGCARCIASPAGNAHRPWHWSKSDFARDGRCVRAGG
jgi:hypothetical protein